MKAKPVQYFTPEYLKECQKLETEDIVRFLEDFRLLHGGNRSSKSKLISIKIPEDLLEAFKTKAKLSGLHYQTQIKNLMREWLAK